MWTTTCSSCSDTHKPISPCHKRGVISPVYRRLSRGASHENGDRRSRDLKRSTHRRQRRTSGARRRTAHCRRQDYLCRADAVSAARAAACAAHRRTWRHDHAGPGRSAFPSNLLQCGRPRRSRHQVSRGIRHAACGRQCPARPRMRVHRGAQRRQPVQYRRLAQEGHRERPRAGAAARGQRTGNLRRRRTDGLESRLSQAGHGGLVLLINGPDEARAAVRKLVKDGIEWVKTYPTGDAAARTPTTITRCA